MTDEITKLWHQCLEPECENSREGNTQYCASHNAANRKAERNALKEPKKKAAIKKQSVKRKEQNSVYSSARATWIVGKRCACCGDPATDVHHKKGRTNDLLNEKKYWLPVCRPCHVLITEDSAWAIKEGYSLPRTTSDDKRLIP